MTQQLDLYTRVIIHTNMPTRTVTIGKRALLDAMELIDEQDAASAAEVADSKDYSHDAALGALKFLEMNEMVRRESDRRHVFYKRPENWLGVQ